MGGDEQQSNEATKKKELYPQITQISQMIKKPGFKICVSLRNLPMTFFVSWWSIPRLNLKLALEGSL